MGELAACRSGSNNPQSFCHIFENKTNPAGEKSKVKPCFWIFHTEQRSVGLVNTSKKTSCGYSKEVDCELPGRDSQKPAAEV